jgi:hypothetical protein
MRQVKELGTIQSIYTNHAPESQLSTYAIGFTSADFIIWDLENETKVTEQYVPYELANQNQQFS